MQQIETITRARVNKYTTAVFISVSAAAFFNVVPLIPAAPVLPILVGLGLGAYSLRNLGGSLAFLYILVYFGILWQLIGFGFFQLLKSAIGAALVIAISAPLLVFTSRRVQSTAFPLAILAGALVFTPYYYVSIPLIAAAAIVSGFASLEALATTFILFLSPFLLLENALYFTTFPNAVSPLAFGQLKLLSENLRPPLTGLNVFLTGLPSNFLSPYAGAVSSFLLQNSGLVLVPLVIMGVVLAISSSVGGFFRSFLERVARRYEKAGFLSALVPVGTSIIISGVFVVLMAVLSQPSIGSFQTSLTNDTSHVDIALMLGWSVILGTAFVGRERLILRLERVEIGRKKLTGLIEECRKEMKQVEKEIDRISTNAPSANLGTEPASLNEDSSYLADVQRQLNGANARALDTWIAHIEAEMLPRLIATPERLRRSVVNELLNVSVVTSSVNDHLAEAGVDIRYPAPPEVSYDTPLDDAIASYKTSMTGIMSVTGNLADLYRSTLESINSLMGQSDFSAPVSPDALLDSHQYVTAMRLVSEEYWLSFQLRWAEELEAKKKDLVEVLGRMEPYLTNEQVTELESISAAISQAKPAKTIELFQKVNELRAFMDDVTSSLEESVELVRKTVGTFGPSVRGALIFQTVNRLDELRSIRKDLGSAKPSLEGVTRALSDAIPVIAGQTAAWKNDQQNLVIVAQYPLARRVIRGMLAKRSRIPASDLPFETRTAAVYLRIYGSEDERVMYDDAKGVLQKNA
jgi:hypothetical protein